MPIYMFVFHICIAELPFFSPGNLIDRPINTTASLSHGLGELEISALKKSFFFFFTACDRGGKKKTYKPRWEIREGNSTDTTYSSKKVITSPYCRNVGHGHTEL